MIPKIKICGITNYADAKFCINNEIDYIGFIFYEKSPRYITPENARNIILKIGKTKIQFVGVFVNKSLEDVVHISNLCGLDLLQIHGDENVSYFENIKKFTDKKIIKTIKIKDENSLLKMKLIGADFFLFDSFSKRKYGGSGIEINFKQNKDINKLFFIAGGLNIDNVEKIIKSINPYAVDISSGVEKKPGIKDYNKIFEIIKIIRGVNF